MEMIKKIQNIRELIVNTLKCTEQDGASVIWINRENLCEEYVPNNENDTEKISNNLDDVIKDQMDLINTSCEKRRILYDKYMAELGSKTEDIEILKLILDFCNRWKSNLSKGCVLKEYPEWLYKHLQRITDDEIKSQLIKMLTKCKQLETNEFLNESRLLKEMNSQKYTSVHSNETMTPSNITNKPQSLSVYNKTKRSNASNKTESDGHLKASQISFLDYTQTSSIEQNSQNPIIVNDKTQTTINDRFMGSPSIISATMINTTNSDNIYTNNPSKIPTPSPMSYTQKTLDYTQDVVADTDQCDMSLVESDKEDENIMNNPICDGDVQESDNDMSMSDIAADENNLCQEKTDKSKQQNDVSCFPEDNSTCWPSIDHVGNLESIIREEDEFQPIDSSIPVGAHPSMFEKSVQQNAPEQSQLIDDSQNIGVLMNDSVDMNNSHPLMNISDGPSFITNFSRLDASTNDY